MNLEKLVFIDESGAKTNMTRLYGRAKEGQRAVDDAPSGHWCTTTMISSVRLDGSLNSLHGCRWGDNKGYFQSLC